MRVPIARFLPIVFGLAAIAGCSQPEAPPPAPAKRAVNKLSLDAVKTELAARPEIDRAAKKIADNKPGDGRVAVVRAVTAAPATITAGGGVNGALSRSDERFDDGSYVDFYTYAGTRGERLTITLRSSAFDAYLLIGDIHDGVFEPDDEDDDSGGNTDARLEVTLGRTGPVTIGANAISRGVTGAYTLLVESSSGGGGRGDSGGGSPAVGDLVFNTPMNGRLEPGDRQMSADQSYYDYWMFDGRAGQRVTITMRSDALDSYLILKRGTPGNSAAFAEDDDSGGGLHARISLALPETGTYVVVANAVGTTTGPYTIAVETPAGGSGRSEPTPAPASNDVPYGDRYPGTGDPTDKYALIVGIDDYPGTDIDLSGSVEDGRVFLNLLTQKFGFKPGNIVVLNNAEATREHIVNAFARHLGQAGPNGAAVFYYSGHGMQLDDNRALTSPIDPEANDGRDEALVVWGPGDRTSYIVDDEIGFLIDQLKTDRVLVVHDSCNSGTSSRAVTADILPREVAMAQIRDTLLTPRRFTIGRQMSGTSTRNASLAEVLETRRQHVLLAGAKDDEEANAVRGLPGKSGFAGAFTHFLTAALADADDTMTFRQVMTRVQSETSRYIRDNFKKSQTPQLGGALGERTVMSILR